MDLANSLSELAKPSKSSIRYPDESDQVHKAKHHKDAVVKHAPLILKVKALQDNLAFKRSTVEDAMSILAERDKLAWKLAEGDIENWKQVLANRFRNMMHVVCKEACKPKPAAWVVALLSGASPSEGRDDPAPAAAASPAALAASSSVPASASDSEQ